MQKQIIYLLQSFYPEHLRRRIAGRVLPEANHKEFAFRALALLLCIPLSFYGHVITELMSSCQTVKMSSLSNLKVEHVTCNHSYLL
jgi:hypothetical protein